MLAIITTIAIISKIANCSLSVDYNVDQHFRSKARIYLADDILPHKGEVIFKGRRCDIDMKDTLVDVTAEGITVNTGTNNLCPQK